MSPDEQIALSKSLARYCEEQIPDTHAFGLIIFPVDQEPGRTGTTYVGKAERADMRRELVAIVKKWDEQ